MHRCTARVATRSEPHPLPRRLPGAKLEPPLRYGSFGRDLFTRAALGGRISIGIGFGATLAILLIGVAYGAISGFVGGKLDNALMRFLDALYGLPYLPFAILALAIVGTVNFWAMVIALSVASWFITARVVRGQIITLKENDYVRAARAIGVRWCMVLGRHLLPNTLGVLVITIFLELPASSSAKPFSPSSAWASTRPTRHGARWPRTAATPTARTRTSSSSPASRSPHSSSAPTSSPTACATPWDLRTKET